MKKLIINADDFGLHTAVNQAIVQGHRQGCISSTSLMASGKAVEDAAALAEKIPALGIGVHLTLVAEKPVLSPDKIPTLVDENGYFFANHMVFIKKYLAGQISLQEVRAECEAQILRVCALGIVPSHIDSHQHLHVLPRLIDLCLSLAQQYDISKVRIPAEPYFFSGGYPAGNGRMLAKCGLTFLAERARSKARQKNFLFPNHFFGMVAGGHMSQRYLLPVLQHQPLGCSEIMVHPGLSPEILATEYDWKYQWQEEFDALTSPTTMQWIKDHHVKLISFKELMHE